MFMADLEPELFDNLFHGCAWAAYADQACEQGGPPDSEATRLRANRYYEAELRAKNAGRPSELTASDAVDRLSQVAENADG